MRISERMRYGQVERRVNEAKDANARAMDRLSTQKDVTKLSDNPIGATQIIRMRDKITDVKDFQKNVEFSQGFLQRSDTALQSISDSLIRAKELAVAMSNDTYDKNSRDATAREIKELKDQVVNLANTTFNGRYIFAGFRNQTPPVTADGNYAGDDGAIFLQLTPGNFRQINLPGRYLFEASPEEQSQGHFNMVHTLEVLYDGLHNNDKESIHKALGELDFQMGKASSAQATIGAMENTLKDASQQLGTQEVQMRERLSKVQDTDMYKATSEFKRTEAVLQGTLMASNKLLQPSLLNFMQ